MIRNIVFDMGNVLLRFDRDLFLNRLNICGEDRALLMREVFGSLEWVQMDRGTLTEAAALERMYRRLPQRLHEAAEELVLRWDEPLIPIESMYELAAELKSAGYGIYLLSNASIRQHEYWPKLPVSQFFDGTLISADERLVKPQPEIYRLLLERFGLHAQECFFVDDIPANVEGALMCGISGAVFYGDVPLLRQALRDAGVMVGK